MMFKAVALFACVLGAMTAPKDTDGEYRAQLMLEFKDFIVAMPVQKMYATLMDHLNNDEEMQAALKYVQAKEFRTEVHTLLSRPSVKELRMKYMEAGLDLERYEKMAADIISGLVFSVPEDTHKSFGNFLADLDKLIPYETLMNLMEKKLEESPVFMRFFDTITAPEMHTLFEKAMHSPEFKRVAQDLEDMDVAVYQILDVLFEIWGWKKEVNQPNDL